MLTLMLPVTSIPKGPDDVDVSKMEKEISHKDVKMLWENQINPISDDERLWL